MPIQKKQFEEDKIKQQTEMKDILRTAIKKLIFQMKVGCKKDVCFNKYCLKNHYGKWVHISDNSFQPNLNQYFSSEYSRKGESELLKWQREIKSSN